MGGTNNVSGNGIYKVPNLWTQPNLKTNETEQTSSATPIKITGVNSVKRENLEEVSPYAAMGLQISKKAPEGSVESYMLAAPEFGRWQGNCTLTESGKKELDRTFTLANLACQNRQETIKNIENSDMFNKLDQAFGLS